MHILRQQQDNQLRDRASEGEKEKREEKKKKRSALAKLPGTSSAPTFTASINRQAGRPRDRVTD